MNIVKGHVLIVLSLLWIAPAATADDLIYFDSSEGYRLLVEAEPDNDFMALTRAFESEKYLTFCSIASSVMALNALNVKSPIDPPHYPYNKFTQLNIFTRKTLKIATFQDVDAAGLTLEQFCQVLSTHHVAAKPIHAADSSLGEFRKKAIGALENEDEVLIINYDRKTVKQVGSGHVSPLAAYHRKTDRFLVMDVARYKYPPSWVTAIDLYTAMNTIDPGSNKTRGYVVVTKEAPEPKKKKSNRP